MGAAGAAVNLATLWLVHGVLGVWVYAAMVVAFSTANFTSFVAVKRWTFKDPCWAPRVVLAQWAHFYTFALIGLGLNFVIFGMLHGHAGWGIYPSQITALVSVAPVHFLLNKFFTFHGGIEAETEPDLAR